MTNLFNILNEKSEELAKKHIDIIEKELKSIIDLGYKNNQIGLIYLPENEYKIFDKKSKSILSYFKIKHVFITKENKMKKINEIEQAISNKKIVTFECHKINEIWEIEDNENIGISTFDGSIFYYHDYEILNSITIE